MAKDWLEAHPSGVYEGAYEFDRKSEQSSGGEQPVFLMGVTYEGESSIAAEDKGESMFQGEAVSHAVFTEALAKTAIVGCVGLVEQALLLTLAKRKLTR
eukprot:scaffold10807_cov79-Phaeocystis_antarctica.AAC.8